MGASRGYGTIAALAVVALWQMPHSAAQIGDAVTVTGTAALDSGTAAAAFTGSASAAFSTVQPTLITNKIIWI